MNIVCALCGGIAAQKRFQVFQTEEMGFPIVLIDSALEIRCTDCGETATEIPFPEKLVAAAALARVQIPVRLNGPELRFLRKALSLKATELATMLETAAETISRWETGKAVIGDKSERILRVIVAAKMGAIARAINYDVTRMMTMKLTPIRNVLLNSPLAFELVTVKEGREKAKEWDELALVA